MTDYRELIEMARAQNLERRFGSWQDYSPGEEDEPIENIVSDAFGLIARLAEALEQQESENERLKGQLQASEIRRCDVCGHSRGRVAYGR